MISTLYDDLSRSLSLPASLVEIGSGRIDVCLPDGSSPAGLYGFPPALIPIWSESSGPGYVGWWIHWFVPRQRTFVKVYVEHGYRAHEFARSPRQLMVRLLIEHITLDDGVTPDVRAVASRLGMVDDLDELDALTATSGDDPLGLVAHPDFQSDPPLECVEAGSYHGDFPTSINNPALAAGLELDEDVAQRLSSSPASPRWLQSGNGPDVFRELLDGGKLGEAWLCLNSPGWEFADAKRALFDLGEKAGSRDFDLLVLAWTELPHERYGGY
jgi:hypothetical protein